MKKVFRIVLLSLFIISLCACAAPEPEIAPEYSGTSESGLDLDGFSVLWGWTDGAGLSDGSNFGFVEGTPNSDLLLEHKKILKTS